MKLTSCAGRSLTSQTMEEHAKESKKDEKKPTYNENPKSIADLGYKFENRKLVDIETGGKFKFVDQKHYELLGDLIVDEIQSIAHILLLLPPPPSLFFFFAQFKLALKFITSASYLGANPS